MQLVCRYGIDPKNADIGVALVDYLDSAVVDMAGYPGCVLVPGQPALDTLPKLGPEPELLGDPPTKTHPSADELKAQGVDKDHPAWERAGRPYADNRRPAADFRPRQAPAQSDPDVLTAYAAQVRYRIETQGIVVDEILVATDRTSQALCEANASRAARDAKFTVRFKDAGGDLHDLTNAQVVDIGDKVGDHVQACRSAESDALAAIKGGKVKTFAALDGIFAKVA